MKLPISGTMTPLPSLSKWGVSPQAELVYRTLTALGPHRLGEINRSLELPRQTVRSALDELYAVGGVLPSNAPQRADDRMWMACAPKAFVAGLKERRERAARYVQVVKDLLDGTGVPIRDDQLHGHSLTGTVRPLYGIPKTRARIAELTSTTDREHCGMSPQPAFTADSVRAAAPGERAAAIRGVPSMGLFVPRAADDESIGLGIEMRSYGAQFRYLPELPVKMMIFDRKTVILPLDQADLPKGAWEITTPSIVEALVSLFLQRWERAEPPNLNRKKGMVLTPREREIVSLLAEGLTDDGVAARLNISRRSISYAIAGMMDRYHAKNRFQLGLMLGAQRRAEKDDQEGT